ncbi:uncharacterized protein LOC131615814 [Vicia villosa]|uniref:uncharacterized protein LOC131615814 n=1 Tax=Vicia villosa TaxID=3911 RepID=UPI00273C18FC|nr:uncharacterized protein LOC131615814 [Vicia villosa]
MADIALSIAAKLADIIDDSPYALKLKNVPRKIAKKCKGLPIAIVTMASMLRGKKVEEWELALLKLEESEEIDVEEVLSSCYACIKLSYDNLTKQVSKNLFLLCSMFPEDYEINMEDLVRYIKGLGPSAGTSGPMEKVRREIQVTMNILKDSHLLQPCGKQEFVKMHDLVRDAALWIASKEGKAIKVLTKTSVAVEENVKEIAAMSLWGMENLPPIDQLQCTALKTLLLHSTDESSIQLPNEYFGKMQMLEVLGITKFYYTWRNLYMLRYLSSSLSIFAVPQSIERLTRLRTLCLRGYDLGDISILASLTRLEILDLRSSSFDELPQGITTLQKLRLLDIYTCRIKKNNPYEVIRKCTQLEELYIWRVEDDSLPIISLPRLHRYVIVCDKSRENCRFLIDAYLEDHVPSRALCIDRFDASALIHDSSSIKDLFLRSKHLYMGHLRGGCKNIVPHMDQGGGMNGLIGLILESCSEIECLLDTTNTNLPAFFELVTLKLIWMNGLKRVFYDPTSQCSLEKLQDLQIEYCTQLSSISFPRNSNMCNLKILRLQWCPLLTSSLFVPAIARRLVLLEELKIFDCSKLKHIIAEEYEEDESASNPSPTLKVFPNLRILHVHGCHSLESIFPISFAQSLERLEKIVIWYNFGLNYVFGTHEYKNSANEIKANVNLIALRRISLVSLLNFIDIFPNYCHSRSPNLKEIECIECPRLSTNLMYKTLLSSDQQKCLTATEERVVFPDSEEPVLALEYLTFENSMVEGIFQLQAVKQGPLNSNLSHLCLKDLPKLSLIWKGPKDVLNLQKLKSLVLVGCRNLETIFSPTIVGSLAELSELVVSKCEKLKQIVCSDNSMRFPLLSIVHVFQCNNLNFLFSQSLPSPFRELEFITIEECYEIEQVFFCNEDDRSQHVPEENKQNLVLPKLREVKLVRLPNITEFSKGPYKLQQNVEHYTARNCPKYTCAWLQEKTPFSTIHLQTKGDVCEMGLGLGSGSTSTFSATTDINPQIQERVSKLETNLESERQRRRLMELDLQVERERRKLIELKLEAEQERRRFMEETMLSFFHKMLGRVPQQFAYLLSQTQSAQNEESEDQDFQDVSIQSL